MKKNTKLAVVTINGTAVVYRVRSAKKITASAVGKKILNDKGEKPAEFCVSFWDENNLPILNI